MPLAGNGKTAIITDFGKNEKDSGSSKVQIALITKRIEDLQVHLGRHRKDNASKRGLLKMVGQRRRLLRYLKRTDLEGYKILISRLRLRK